ncbi:Efflux pump FUS6 [Hypsizygus marmoreus]|uniref:Efflux pump FUS6 n=1 Tax=Hypsizygus marmoreus TaxID=39966 RepID=A0A369JZW1_HYPMA|nr:Efflux pump FUS6 [Hypsizygus marmoreus]
MSGVPAYFASSLVTHGITFASFTHVRELIESMSQTPSKVTTENEGVVAKTPTKGTRFWLAMVCIMLSTFLAAFDTTSVATALPTIVADLHGTEFVWIGSGYTLASVASIPMSAHLANIFGRRPILLSCILLFALGSALCGGAQSMAMLIGGRAVQGSGAGGILALTEIILSDLVPLQERGMYQGLIGSVWSIACTLGPPVGGAFASRKDWTWRGLFYLNLPLTGIALVACIFCLDLKVPKTNLSQKLARIDWAGNAIIVASTTSVLLGLTWGGIRFPWSSASVLVPLILGLAGIAAFVVYEAFVPVEPTMPIRLLRNRTSISGYLATAVHGILVAAVFFYIPVYFQACKGHSPIRSGVDLLPYSFSVAPAAIFIGATTSQFNCYRIQNVVSWCFVLVGLGLHTILHVDSAVRNWVGFEFIAGIGFGMLFVVTTFPILAPLPVSDNGSALGLFIFIRSFFQAWGVTIGSTVLENQLKVKLPEAFIQLLPQGLELSYGAIPQISALAEPLRRQVRDAFSGSLVVLWQVLLGISALGLLSTLLMKELPMQTVSDERWGLNEQAKADVAGKSDNATVKTV